MDIAYYPKDTVLISPEKNTKIFFIIIKGSVFEYSPENVVVMDYQSKILLIQIPIYGKCENSFRVNEELICYEIEKNFLELIDKNQKFKDFFLKRFSK